VCVTWTLSVAKRHGTSTVRPRRTPSAPTPANAKLPRHPRPLPLRGRPATAVRGANQTTAPAVPWPRVRLASAMSTASAAWISGTEAAPISPPPLVWPIVPVAPRRHFQPKRQPASDPPPTAPRRHPSQRHPRLPARAPPTARPGWCAAPPAGALPPHRPGTEAAGAEEDAPCSPRRQRARISPGSSYRFYSG
jgi:hypothetical protein